jgi:hypothetical protein
MLPFFSYGGNQVTVLGYLISFNSYQRLIYLDLIRGCCIESIIEVLCALNLLEHFLIRMTEITLDSERYILAFSNRTNIWLCLEIRLCTLIIVHSLLHLLSKIL